MFLKALEIQGFKSFPDKIKLDIPQGLTAVVGPNGSGKSNISDAIRWVLGEQSSKSLRGDKMEDVIFNGTSELHGSKKRGPSGFAEVSVIIDNSDYSLELEAAEVKITRKYFRSGESEYLINSQAVRLTDIKQLFMDTGLGGGGYSMIGQGKIDEIIKSKPTDRRGIFEEAAGIAKFRFKKEQAQRRLAATEENLLRLRDILGELETRVQPLKEQSQKAQEFLFLSDEKRKLEISLWIEKIDSLKQLLQQHDNKIYACKNDYEQSEALVLQAEEEIQSIYKEMEHKLTKIENLRREKREFETNISSHNENIAVLNNDILHNSTQIQRICDEKSLSQISSKETESLVAQNTATIISLKKERQNQNQVLFQTEKDLQEVSGKSADFSDYITDVTRQINIQTNLLSNAKVAIAGFSTTKEEIISRLHIIEEDSQNRQKALELLKEDANQCATLLDNLIERKTENENSKSGYQEILAMKEKKVGLANEKIHTIVAETESKKNKVKLLSDMEKSMDGFAYSVKFVVSQMQRGMLNGIYGPVFRLINTQPQHTIAIETALGGAMQNIVCQAENDAKQAIYALKKADSGRATFLPVENIKGTRLSFNELCKCDGYVGLACDLPTYDKKFENIIFALLGRTVIAEDFDSASAIAKKFGYKFKIVTLDGQIIHPGGSLTGGSNSKNSGLLSRRSEIEKLISEVKKAEDAIASAQKSLNSPVAEIGNIKAILIGIENDIITVNEDIIKTQSQKSSIEKSIKDTVDILNTFKVEQSAANNRLEKLNIDNEEYTKSSQKAQEKIDELEKEIELSGDSRHNLKARRNTLFDLLNEKKLGIVAVEKDIESLESTNAMLCEKKENEGQRLSSLDTQLELLQLSNKGIADQIQSIKCEMESAAEKMAEFDKTISILSKERMEIEGTTQNVRVKQKDITAKKEDISRELIRLEERKNTMMAENENLINSLLDEYELTLSEAYEYAEKIDNVQKAQKEVNSIKNKIRALGVVNVAAIEEYKQVKERYDFLNTQICDVESSKKQLNNLIGELSGTMKKLFIDEFAKINSNFSKIFCNLFGGGSASLQITDPADVLNSGIEIIVAPPGKVINNISSLSGGEHALIAVSIYFAILKVRPSPFCVLDEIDAALDDVNVSKLTAYLRSMNDRTQFIAITHKRGTMEDSDVLYGITMQEKGVSKLLKMDVTEVEEKLGINAK